MQRVIATKYYDTHFINNLSHYRHQHKNESQLHLILLLNYYCSKNL